MHRQSVLRQLTESIRSHDLYDAKDQCEELISTESEKSDFLVVLKYLLYWLDVEEDAKLTKDHFEAALKYIHSWKSFEQYAQTLSPLCLYAFYAMQFHAYTSAIALFQAIYERGSEEKQQMLLHIGRAYRKIGNYEEAIKNYLNFIKVSSQFSASVYAELGDAYAMCGELVRAKVFFREAFSLSPQEIDLQSLESDLLIKLVEKVKSIEPDVQLAKEWIPVYAVIWGIFSVKRELRQIEVVQMKQSIVQLEQEYQEHPEERKFLLPRLINHYIRLIEHYGASAFPGEHTKELLLKIQSICPEIYNQYIQ